ncbi:MAG TPA: protein arginine kinase [Firmicutes bacterium]|nr:protein arginine kinase [Candidatus Fermentithermobacillaceae bacterium]
MRREEGLLENIVRRSSSPWMDGSGTMSDVVISSRVRLARNLRDVEFPHRMDEKAAKAVFDKVKNAVLDVNARKAVPELTCIDLEDVSPLDRQVLVEKHLMSPQHAQPLPGRGLVTRPDERVSIMVNEEDHLRIQCLYSGLELDEAYITANGMDDLLDERLDFAYDDRTGFLTACPTNVGTGLRASVMVHLPALAIGDEVSRVLSAVNKMGLVVRGLYGEGTEGQGNVYQVSNQITLGQSEKEILENLSLIAKQVVAEEKRYRETLMKNRRSALEDRIFRAWGILTNARSMSSEEAVRLWSDVRLGVELGLIDGPDVTHINEILVIAQPNFVMRSHGRTMSSEERDIARAELLRRHLASMKS